MAGPVDVGGVRVGVLLGREPDGIGEWLADAAAFDAGGADALWVECAAEWDALALAAALAVVTYRARLVVATPDAGAVARRTVDTVGRLSRGRLALVGASGAVRRVPGEPGSFDCDGDGIERWVSVAAPQGRAEWRAVLVEAAERGARGVVVPADPRLLDILRNPDDPGERTDLQLAQG